MSQLEPYDPREPDRGRVTDQIPLSGAIVATAWVIALLTAGYWLPWAVAATRGRANQLSIAMVNLLLGWTGIGWIVALVMACQPHALVGPLPYEGPMPGWYPAPAGYGQEYWDGRAWTGHFAP